MAPSQKSVSNSVLTRVNFPLYAVEMLTSRHCLVAGGGGSAKTGVTNGFQIFEIHFDGTKFVADECIRHETDPNAIMNCAFTSDGHSAYLATGQENLCQLYHIKSLVAGATAPTRRPSAHVDDKKVDTTARQRMSKISSSTKEDVPTETSRSEETPTDRIVFDITGGDCVQTDFLETDPLQRVVRIAPSGKLMATGGTDGHIRVWSFPRMQLLHDIPLHTREADDLDFSPDSKRIVSIAKDGRAIVSSAETGAELTKLQWTVPEGSKYLFKRCRFAVQEGKAGKCVLFTIANPCGRGGKQKGVLQQWDADHGRLTRIVEANESLSALAVRDDGRFVAVGTMFTGSVSIYIAFSLQQVLHVPNVHSMFVTGVEFLPLNNYGPEISSNAEAAVLSISVDNKVCIHSLKPRQSISLLLAGFIIVLVLFMTFYLCSLLGV